MNVLTDTRPRSRMLMARIACAALGGALLTWGLAPAIVERIVTGQAPQGQTIAEGGAAVALGTLFLLLQALFAFGRKWSLWAANLLSLLIIFANVSTVIFMPEGGVATFPLILSGFSVFATWLALGVTEVPELVSEDASAATRGAPHSGPIFSPRTTSPSKAATQSKQSQPDEEVCV